MEIRTRDGRLVARVDFLFRQERIVIEFDGAMKYDGVSGRDALRALGFRVVRLTWADLHHPERVLAALTAAAAA